MKRFVALIMLMSMMFSSLAFAPSDRIEDRISDQEPTRVEEVKELRERNSETYLLSDGSYECVVFAENKYYKDGSGKLAEIDNSIKKIENPVKGSNYSYKPAANDTIFYFAENMPSIKAESVDMSFSFRLNNTGKTAMKTKAVPGGSEKYQTIFDYPMSGESCLTYPNTLPDTDIIYNTADGNLKEYIVLRSANAPTEFRFTFETNGLSAQKADDGTVEFVDENGEIAFSLSSLFAVDAAGAYTEKLGYEIISADKNSAVIEIRLSTDYVNDPARVFPVMIDPSVMITGASITYDSFVSSSHPSTNYYMSTSLCTGKDSSFGVRWSYIKFDLPSEVMGKEITGAYMKIRKSGGSAPNVKAYRVTTSWNSSGVSWNSRPSNHPTEVAGPAVLGSNNWYTLYMTNYVKLWCSGTYPNYGVLLRDTNESSTSQWTTFYSSDAASPNKPELHITYNNNTNSNNSTASFVYYINNKYWGKYIHRSNSSSVDSVSGLVSNYGGSIRWVATDIGNGKYTLCPENDKSRFLIDDTTSGIRLYAAPTTQNIPNKYLWSITSASGGGRLIKNIGTNKYISESSASALTTVTGTGTAGTDAYNKCVWRVETSGGYKELSSFTIPTTVSIDVGSTKTISISGKSPSGAMWADTSDFSFSFSSGTSGAVSVDSSGKITGKKCGIATYTVTHKATGRSKTIKIYVDALTERLVNHFGFEDNAAVLIREVYNRVDQYYPSESVKKRAWRASRLLASFDYYDGTLDLYDTLASEVIDHTNLKSYFVTTLKFSENEYNTMSAAAKKQHKNGVYPDFTHEQYALAVRLAYRLNLGVFSGSIGNSLLVGLGMVGSNLSREEISYLGGWFGDAVLVENGTTTELKNDDYCADLDAENIFRLIDKGQSIVSAYKTYHASLTTSNTRAAVFKTYIDYATAKQKVYDILIDIDLRTMFELAVQTGNVILAAIINDWLDINSPNYEKFHQKKLYDDYRDTYNFLHSLKDGRAELRSYNDDYPDYHYDMTPSPDINDSLDADTCLSGK